MFYTSAEANKLIRKLKEDESFLMQEERDGMSFQAAVGEDIEDVRPEYRFRPHSEALAEVQRKIRKVKHALNVFNATTIVEGLDMTIDELLVYLPQLNTRKAILERMLTIPKKKRSGSYGSGTSALIDYTYANFDPEEVKTEYERIRDLINTAQGKLDSLNNSLCIEIDI